MAWLTGYDYRNISNDDKTDDKIFETIVYSDGSTGDLRYMFPALLTGGYYYLGKSSGSTLKFKLYQNDKLLEEIRTY